MNKIDKRQLNLRNKLLAAVAMLLVSSIMMVSSTYAWFTLSTAPEVQGITTTIGANGNLEIALVNGFELANDGKEFSTTTALLDSTAANLNKPFATTTGDHAQAWETKNFTWGNLVSFYDKSSGSYLYGLDNVTLKPAQLDITQGADTNPNTIAATPLRVPTYGTDGRISALSSDGIVIGAQNTNTGGFEAGKGYGVRAIGSASSMSPEAIKFANAVAAIQSNMVAAKTAASKALQDNGSAFSGIAMDKVAGETDFSGYSANLKAMVTDLEAASALVEDALFNAVLAMSLTTANTDATFTTATVEAAKGNGFANFWNSIPAAIKTAFPKLETAYNEWNAANTNISTSKSNVANGVSTWQTVSDALANLMNMNSVTINGYKIDEAESHLVDIVKNPTLQMGEGSGVFDNLAKLVGTISANTILPEGTEVKGYNIGGLNIYVTTTTTVGPYLSELRTAVNTATRSGGGAEISTIDNTYGYVLDFWFRTNAANSNLLLQTDATERITGDATGETMGNGSTMTFSSVDYQNLIGLMNGIRVVFFDTVSGTDVYGIAKLDMSEVIGSYEVADASAEGGKKTVNYIIKHVVVEDNTATTDVDESFDGYKWYELDGTTEIAAPEEGTEVTVTGSLRLYEYTVNDSKVIEFTDTTNTTICGLNQNVEKAVSVMVYLDGDDITNADIGAGENGIASSGVLNLQFASSATLVPMSNSSFTDVDTPSSDKYTVKLIAAGIDVTEAALGQKNITLDAGASYTNAITGYDLSAFDITVKMGSVDITSTAWDASTNTLTLNDVNGNVEIIATAKTGN